MQRISENYVGTFHTESAADMLELERIRKAIKVVNAELRRFKYGSRGKKSGYGNEHYHQFYVKCQGRGARTSAALADGKHARQYDQSLPLRHAERMDAYVYQK